MAFSLPGLLRLEVSVQMEDYFLEDDQVVENQRRFDSLFGSGEFVAVLVEAQDVFALPVVQMIRSLSQSLEEGVPFAQKTRSFLNTGVAPGRGYRFDQEGELLNSSEELKGIRQDFLNSPVGRGVLYSEDAREAWVILPLDPYPTDWTGKKSPQYLAGEGAYKIVQVYRENLPPGTSLFPGGTPVYAQRKEVEMTGDFIRILVVGVILSTLLSTLTLRTLPGVGAVLLLILSTLVIVFGQMGWLGVSADSAFLAVPILLTMGVSIGYTIHITRFLTLGLWEGKNRKEAVCQALEKTARPIFFTAVTTMIGLLSFLFVRIKPIRWIGLTSAFCILGVFLLCMTLVPAFLSLGRGGGLLLGRAKKEANFLVRFFGRKSLAHPKLVLLITLGFVGLCLYGITLVKVDFRAQKMMGTALPHMQDQLRVGNSQIGSGDFMDLTIILKEGAFRDPRNLRNLETLEEKIRTLPLVKGTNSLARGVRSFNWLMKKGEEGSYDLPQGASTLRALYNVQKRVVPQLQEAWVSPDFSTTRLFIELSDFSSATIEGNIRTIKGLVGEVFPESEFFMSGSTMMMALMNQYITKGLVSSIMVALTIIGIIMIFLFKSVSLGLIAMVPNVLPILSCGAIMGFLGIPLEFVTMTVTPLIVGLAVDDTIHFISYLQKLLSRGEPLEKAVGETFEVVGIAISETTLILGVSFLAFTASKVNSMIYMGILSSAGILVAYLADVLVTPSLIWIYKDRKRPSSKPLKGGGLEPSGK